MFVRCVAAQFNPVYRREEPIKRGLVSCTEVMFALVTAGTIMELGVKSISYIDKVP